MKHLSLLAAMLCLFAGTLKAADEITPSEQIQKLHKTVGKWKINETDLESPFGPAGESHYETELRATHKGFYIEEKAKGESMGKALTYSTITYWDGQAKTLRGLYYDSNGFVLPVEGKIEGDTLSFAGSVDFDGKKLQLKGATTFAFDYKSSKSEWSYSDDDGKTWKKLYTATATRTGK